LIAEEQDRAGEALVRTGRRVSRPWAEVANVMAEHAQ
jgi:hypothetical protein